MFLRIDALFAVLGMCLWVTCIFPFIYAMSLRVLHL